MADNALFKDIMPIETIEINYWSYLPFIAAVFTALLILVYIFKKFSTKKRYRSSSKHKALEKLKQLKFEQKNQKKLLYDFTIYAKEYEKEVQVNSLKLQKILQDIEPYKYHKNHIKLDYKIKAQIQRYIDELVS